jgi:hypothetical protein
VNPLLHRYNAGGCHYSVFGLPAVQVGGVHHHVTNQAIASMPMTPRPTGAVGDLSGVRCLAWLAVDGCEYGTACVAVLCSRNSCSIGIVELPLRGVPPCAGAEVNCCCCRRRICSRVLCHSYSALADAAAAANAATVAAAGVHVRRLCLNSSGRRLRAAGCALSSCEWAQQPLGQVQQPPYKHCPELAQHRLSGVRADLFPVQS